MDIYYALRGRALEVERTDPDLAHLLSRAADEINKGRNRIAEWQQNAERCEDRWSGFSLRIFALGNDLADYCVTQENPFAKELAGRWFEVFPSSREIIPTRAAGFR